MNIQKTAVLFLLMSMSGLFLGGWISAVESNQISQIQPTPESSEPFNYVIIDLPEDATQLSYGEEVYRLVCSACHAYDGSGLTDEWRSTWSPEDQNCWQSKCHGYNHPEDGFYLPDSPPVVGSFVPYLFPNAAAMYDLIMRTMPWQNPGSLPEDKGWAVTAYVLALNGYTPPSQLGPDNADEFILPKPTQVEQPRQEIESFSTPTFETVMEMIQDEEVMENEPSKTKNWFQENYLIFIAIIVLVLSGIFLLRLRYK